MPKKNRYTIDLISPILSAGAKGCGGLVIVAILLLCLLGALLAAVAEPLHSSSLYSSSG